MRNISFLVLITIFLGVCIVNGYDDDVPVDALGSPKCEDGSTSCKRVSDRRKKKQKQKENQFFVLPKDDPEQIKIDNMMNWLKLGSVELPKMDIVYFYKNFRGAAATRKIFTGDTILFVPKSHLITYESSIEESALARRFLAKKVQAYNSRHTVVAMQILEQKEDPNSFWKPYLDIFPDNYHEFPLNFGEREISILQNSSFVEDIKNQQQEFKNDYQKIVEQLPEFEFFSQEEFSWARLAVQSRIFGVTIDGESSQAMVPFADMLNHARVQPTEWSYNQQRGGFVITAKSDIDKGAEIYDTYGRKLNRIFYQNYGFLEAGNDLNVADIYTCLSARDSLYQLKLRLFNQNPCLKFRIQNSTQDSSFNEALSISRVLSVQEIDKFFSIEKSLGKKPYTKTPPVSIEGEVKALETLKGLILNQLSVYKTTIEEDIESMNKEPDWAIRNVYNLVKMEKEVKQSKSKIIYNQLMREISEKVQYLISLYTNPPNVETLAQRVEKRELSLSDYLQYLKNVFIPLQSGLRPE